MSTAADRKIGSRFFNIPILTARHADTFVLLGLTGWLGKLVIDSASAFASMTTWTLLILCQESHPSTRHYSIDLINHE